jgi:hypothetical protein
MLSKDRRHGFTTVVLSIERRIRQELTFSPNLFFRSKAHTSTWSHAVLYSGDQLTLPILRLRHFCSVLALLFSAG